MENIEIYFESIRQVYNQILEWRKERENRPEPLRQKIANFISISLLVLFILSLIPILPSLFVFLGSRFSWTVFNFQLNQANIWTYVLAWLISSVTTITLFLLSLWLDSSINPPLSKEKLKPPQTLSSEQLTFIFTYQAYKELKIFFVSHIDQHIEKALTSLGELQQTTVNANLDDEFGRRIYHDMPDREIERYYLSQSLRVRTTRSRSSLSRQISVAQEFLKTFEKFPWFHIDDLTKSRLQALISFQKKILIRLKKREDLPAVLSVLENLSKFLYAFLPEHQTNLNSDELKALELEGTKCLDKFVEDVAKLIDYPVEQRPGKIEHSIENLTLFQKIQIFYFSNIFFRFIIWLLMLLAVTTSLVYIASVKIANLDINIMVSTVIAASVTGATAMAVIGARPQKTVRDLKNKGIQKLHDSIEIDDAE